MLHSTVATLTSKGQLTIPKAIRDALGLHEGDQVRFELDKNNGKTVMEPVRFRPEDLSSFAIPGARRMTFAEMEAAKRAGALR
jgi:AbrB family looped-hinge helix DNA binding protein